MDKIRFTGYHATTQAFAEEILSTQTFVANKVAKDDWLGEGIYFWDEKDNANWWEKVHFKDKKILDTCILSATLECDPDEYVDLTTSDGMERLVDFAEDISKEMAREGKVVPKFENVHQVKHFFCTFFKYRNKIRLMRHTFEHDKFNIAGFKMGVLPRVQLCATDNSIIRNIKKAG